MAKKRSHGHPRYETTIPSTIRDGSVLPRHKLCIFSAQKFDSWSENVISGEISVEKTFFGKILFHQKISLWSLLSYFWAFVLISAVISIWDDFGSLLPARTVTVKKSETEYLINELFEISKIFRPLRNFKSKTINGNS